MYRVFPSLGSNWKDEIVRVWILKVVIATSVVSGASSISSSSWSNLPLCGDARCSDLMVEEEELPCEQSHTPRLPSLSPAKTRGLSRVGWKAREYCKPWLGVSVKGYSIDDG